MTGIIGLSINASGEKSIIPEWIKNNAKWWSEGTITEADYISGLQYLITQGVIKIPIKEVDGQVANYLRDIYAANPLHKYLVDNTKQRSLADPWIIAHAIKEKACVVTKEEKVTAPNTTRIKIRLTTVIRKNGIRLF